MEHSAIRSCCFFCNLYPYPISSNIIQYPTLSNTVLPFFCRLSTAFKFWGIARHNSKSQDALWKQLAAECERINCSEHIARQRSNTRIRPKNRAHCAPIVKFTSRIEKTIQSDYSERSFVRCLSLLSLSLACLPMSSCVSQILSPEPGRK